MSRIQKTFARLREQKRCALIPYVTAGDPSLEATLSLMHAMVQAGADVIELGVPFSDPMADGPTIQRSSERAVARGVSLRQVLDVVSQFRKQDTDTPVVLMGYANPIEAMGQGAFVEAASHAGIDGVLTVDYPPQESETFAANLQSKSIDPIFLLAPTSTPERFAQVAKMGSGYIYYVSLNGVTGSGELNLDDVVARISTVTQAVGLPVGVGFGIRDAASAAKIASVADAVIIGSQVIEEIEKSSPEQINERVGTLLRGIRQAMDAQRQATAGV